MDRSKVLAHPVYVPLQFKPKTISVHKPVLFSSLISGLNLSNNGLFPKPNLH